MPTVRSRLCARPHGVRCRAGDGGPAAGSTAAAAQRLSPRAARSGTERVRNELLGVHAGHLLDVHAGELSDLDHAAAVDLRPYRAAEPRHRCARPRLVASTPHQAPAARDVSASVPTAAAEPEQRLAHLVARHDRAARAALGREGGRLLPAGCGRNRARAARDRGGVVPRARRLAPRPPGCSPAGPEAARRRAARYSPGSAATLSRQLTVASRRASSRRYSSRCALLNGAGRPRSSTRSPSSPRSSCRCRSSPATSA